MAIVPIHARSLIQQLLENDTMPKMDSEINLLDALHQARLDWINTYFQRHVFVDFATPNEEVNTPLRVVRFISRYFPMWSIDGIRSSFA